VIVSLFTDLKFCIKSQSKPLSKNEYGAPLLKAKTLACFSCIYGLGRVDIKTCRSTLKNHHWSWPTKHYRFKNTHVTLLWYYHTETSPGKYLEHYYIF